MRAVVVISPATTARPVFAPDDDAFRMECVVEKDDPWQLALVLEGAQHFRDHEELLGPRPLAEVQ